MYFTTTPLSLLQYQQWYLLVLSCTIEIHTMKASFKLSLYSDLICFIYIDQPHMQLRMSSLLQGCPDYNKQSIV